MAPPAVSSSSASKGFNGTTSGNSPVVTLTSTSVDESTRFQGKVDVDGDGFIRLSSLTHDTFVAMQHTSMQRLGEDLQSAAKAVFTKQEGIRYSQVFVLLLSWLSDDLGVASEIQRLRHVFEDIYQFQVQTYLIPDEKPDRALKGRILQFLIEDQDDNLLIFYYAGHARRGPQSNEGPLWFPNRQNPLITIPSSGIQTLLEEADSDVLLLYDCCHSAAITTTGCYQGNKGVKEVISACGYETVAPEVDKHSFTNSLIETLALASRGSPFSVGELHSRVLSRLKCWTASLLYDKDGKILETADGKLAEEHQPRRTPIYSILRESKPRRSIVLAPLNPVQRAPADEPQRSPSISPPTSTAGLDMDRNIVTSRKTKKRKREADQEKVPDWPQIVLSVRLDEAELDFPRWREWIRSLPTEAKDIKIEGLYKSFSTLLLIRMPTSVWNLLPNNGAYSFVGFVTSENLAMLQEQRAPTASEEATQETQLAQDGETSPERTYSNERVSETNIEENIIKPGESSTLVSKDEEVLVDSVESHPPSHPFNNTPEATFQPGPAAPQPSLGFSNTRSLPTPVKSEGRKRTKVASACVPCKKAHLRCDTQRPCSRCISNEKEDDCVDVQQQKRSRPRLASPSKAQEEHPSSRSSMRRSLSVLSPSSPRVNISTQASWGTPRTLSISAMESASQQPSLSGHFFESQPLSPSAQPFDSGPSGSGQYEQISPLSFQANFPLFQTAEDQLLSEATASIEQWRGPLPWSHVPAAETSVDPQSDLGTTYPADRDYPDKMQGDLKELVGATGAGSDDDEWNKKRRSKKGKKRRRHRSGSRGRERDKRGRGGGGGSARGGGGNQHGIEAS